MKAELFFEFCGFLSIDSGDWLLYKNAMEANADKKRTELLVLRAQSNDRVALDRLLKIHQTGLFRYLLKMLGGHADAEDTLQATLIQAVKKIRYLREPGSFRPWIYRIASRMAYQTLGSRKRDPTTVNPETIDAIVEPVVTEPPNAELLALIPHWLNEISALGKEVVVLHYIEGFTTEQVAEILGIPVGTAKSRISYALSCIRNCAKYERHQL